MTWGGGGRVEACVSRESAEAECSCTVTVLLVPQPLPSHIHTHINTAKQLSCLRASEQQRVLITDLLRGVCDTTDCLTGVAGLNAAALLTDGLPGCCCCCCRSVLLLLLPAVLLTPAKALGSNNSRFTCSSCCCSSNSGSSISSIREMRSETCSCVQGLSGDCPPPPRTHTHTHTHQTVL